MMMRATHAIRATVTHQGRAPSTVSREIARHTDGPINGYDASRSTHCPYALPSPYRLNEASNQCGAVHFTPFYPEQVARDASHHWQECCFTLLYD